MVFINLALSVSVVFLMRYVQNLLNSDVKINLVEIVTQNKDAITSRLMMNVNSLDITANKLSDRLKAEESSGKLKTQDLIEQYAKENNTDDLFTANRDGMALFDGGRKLDISGRHYFRLAIDGIPNISDKLISRINGDEVFVISVPLSYNGEIVGTIQKVITFEEMYKICSLSIFSSQGYMYVINREGYVILHSAHPKCEQKSDNYFRDLYGAGNPKASEQMKRDIYQKDVPIERVRKMKKESRKSRKWGAACVALAGFLLFLCILQFFHIDSLLTRTGLGLAIAALLYLAYSLFRHRKTEVEQVVTEPEEQAIRRQQWNVDRLKQELGQKQTVLSNLQSEYEELCISMTEKDHLQEELDALSLAGEAIQSLSVQMQSRIGDRLKQQMSKTLSSLTNGRYLQVNMDENLRIGLHTADEYVPLEQVSRGTIEQAYFALRMAAMDVLCGEEELPVILDESFAFYDENRLKETLKWLAENRTQVLLFTCQKREEEALSEMGIPYRKIVL